MPSRASLRHPRTPANSRGIGLIEVLIAVLILGIGMLGIAAMQASALRTSQNSLQRSQAVVEANAILDAMRANLPVARGNGYNLAMATAPCTAPTGGDLAANDLNYWITSLQATMGAGSCGSVNCAGNVCTVVVQWNSNLGATESITAVSRL